MMGGSRGSDPRLAAYGEVVDLLTLLSKPKAMATLADQMGQKRDEILKEIEAADQALAAARQKHDEREAGIQRREVDLADRVSAADQRESALDYREDAIRGREAVCANAEASRQAQLAEVEAMSKALDVRKTNLDQEHDSRLAALETKYTERHMAVAQRENAVSRRETAADQAIRDNVATAAALDGRAVRLVQQERTVEAKSKAVEQMRVEYEEKLEKLRSLIT